MRDIQREKVYQAEYRLRDLFDTAVQTGNPTVTVDGVTLTLPPEARFGCLESMQSYCDQVTKLVGAQSVRVRERRGQRKAHYQHGEIAVPVIERWAMRETVVLHELAHHLSIGHAHDHVFVATFADLLSQVMGPEAGLLYRLLCQHSGASMCCPV